jgi:hypothetical protein
MATSQEPLEPTETESELTCEAQDTPEPATCEAQDTPEPIQTESTLPTSTSHELVTGMI